MQEPILSESIFKPSDNVAWRDVKDEMVILKLESGKYYTFNEVGRSVWLLITDGKTIEETAQKISQEYEVDIDKALSDVVDFVKGLLENGLITFYDVLSAEAKNEG